VDARAERPANRKGQNKMKTTTTKTSTNEKAIAEIARRILRIETIETRNSDALDFHDLAVWNIREALEAAYEAGMARKGR